MCSRIEFRIILLILCPGVVFTDILQLPFSNDRNAASIPTRAVPMPLDSNSSEIQNASMTSAPDGSAQLRNDTVSLPGPWLADMFYQALSNFTVHENVGTTVCQKQTQMYVKNLKNNSYWAVKMYDSWSRYPVGILVGATYQMGVYEECINVHKPIQGKYCMAAIKLGSVDGKTFELNHKDELESFDQAWNEILGFVDYQDRNRRNEVKIGICIPESCTSGNMEISLQHKLNDVFLPHRVQPKVSVDPMLCSTDKPMYPYDTGYYVTGTIMCMLLLVCSLSTAYHLVVITRYKNLENERNIPESVYWFSMISNGRTLIKHNKNNVLNIFNGLKVLVMLSILYGHKYLVYATHPVLYADQMERVYRVGPDILLTCMNLVDPFFFITGYLMYVMIKPELMKRGSGWIQIPMIVFYKYIRMIPAYGIMMLLTMYSIPYMYQSVFWGYRMWPESEKCKNYWWANVLGISNFMEPEKQCLIAGWYVSCLLQFLVIGTIIIYVCLKNRKVGVGLMIILLYVSLSIPFIMTYTSRAYGLVRVVIPFFENTSSSYEFRHLYMPFYIRGVPFYAGMLAAVVIEEMKKREYTLSKPVIYVWTIIISVVCYQIQTYGAVFYDRKRPYNVVEHAAYASLSHCTWTFWLFWIVISHINSGYGPILNVFNNRFVTLFGRLSYSVYLVNIPVMMIIEYRQSTSISPTFELWIDSWIVGACRSYFAGLLLHLIVEAPFNIIIKTIFFGRKNISNKEFVKNHTERRNSKTENVSNTNSSHL